ncbi:unnamed protein product [Durusdinium trenchii]|uniref:HEAT repeat-containing protein 1 n=1 Tax=Durusdinium trenchii TaxID=1381693 RepID=A0ABP0HF78_9DINO
MSIDAIEAVFDGANVPLETWQTLALRPVRKRLGGLLAATGAAINVEVPVRETEGRLRDAKAVRSGDRQVKLARLKSSSLLERRQAAADEVLRKVNGRSGSAAEACLDEWLQGFYAEMSEQERLQQALCDALPAAVHEVKVKAAEGKSQIVLLKSLHWLMLKSNYTVLKDRFGLCLPVLLQILESSTDSLLRFVGWDVLNLLLDRAMAVEVQNFGPCLADFFESHSPFFLQEELGRLTVAPFASSFVLFILKAYPGHESTVTARDEQLERFLRFGCFHCKAQAQAFCLFLEFGLLPLLAREALLLAPSLQEISVLLLQSCESPQIIEVLLSWRCVLLLFRRLPQRLPRYFQDILLRVIFGFLTFVASDAPESLGLKESPDSIRGFRAPVVASMSSAEWEEAEARREELAVVLQEGSRLNATLTVPKGATAGLNLSFGGA